MPKMTSEQSQRVFRFLVLCTSFDASYICKRLHLTKNTFRGKLYREYGSTSLDMIRKIHRAQGQKDVAPAVKEVDKKEPKIVKEKVKEEKPVKVVEKVVEKVEKVKKDKGDKKVATIGLIKEESTAPQKEEKKEEVGAVEEYPQAQEENEYRYIDPIWLNEVAKGLTQGAKNHPTGCWKKIPALEHAARALRHINLFRTGDLTDPHIINATTCAS